MQPLKHYGFSTEPAGFAWATGIEGSIIHQMGIDQYAWADHYSQFAADLDLARNDLGVKWVRYPMPWDRINPARGEYDWSWTDRALSCAEMLGIQPLVNLCHFGTAGWIEDAFGNPEFPTYLEEYSRAFARRYHKIVRYYTPINEPMITALFAGEVGWWPPFWRGMQNYTRVLGNICRGLVLSYRAIKSVRPDAVCVFADATELHRTSNPALREVMDFRNTRRFLLYDLISGRVDESHPLHHWLLENGMAVSDLEWLQENAIRIDVLGMDYYRHTERQIYWRNGAVAQRIAFPIRGLYEVARDYSHRYDCPIFLTETNWCGPVQHRIDWLHYTVNEVRRLREDGVPIVGYTWWPLFDHFDWEYAMTRACGHIHPVGLYHLLPGGMHPDQRPQRLISKHGSGTILHRVSSPLADAYRELIRNSARAVGAIGRGSEHKVHRLAFARQPASHNAARRTGEPPDRGVRGVSRWSPIRGFVAGG